MFSVHRHFHLCLVVLGSFHIFVSDSQSVSPVSSPSPGSLYQNHNLNAFIDSEHDLLAVPSDQHQIIADRNGPVTDYAFDNVAVESKSNGRSSVVVVPPPTTTTQQTMAESKSEQVAVSRGDIRSRRRKPVVTVSPSTSTVSEENSIELGSQPIQEQSHNGQIEQPNLPPQQQYHVPPQQHYHYPQEGQTYFQNPYLSQNQQLYLQQQQQHVAQPPAYFFEGPALAITPVVASVPGDTAILDQSHHHGLPQQQAHFAPEQLQGHHDPYSPVIYEGVVYNQIQQPSEIHHMPAVEHNHLQQLEQVQHPQHAVAASDYDQMNPAEIYNDIMLHPTKIIHYFTMLAEKFKVPKEHYLNVISFVGVYLFMSYLFYSSEDILQLTCEATNGKRVSHKEWTYQAGRRFVAAPPIDRKLQLAFFDLFKGAHLDGGDSSSSEEDFSGEVGHISELCPKGEFFYSMSPTHIEAWTQLQRLFVGLHSPADVVHLAKDLLYKQKVHPKIWYLGLIAAALERPDMTGLIIPQPLDAMPDLFLPAHLIKDDYDRYRALSKQRRSKRAITTISLVPRNTTIIRISKVLSTTRSTTTKPTTTQTATVYRDIPESAEISGEYIGLDGKPIVTPQQQPPATRKGDQAKVLQAKQKLLKAHNSMKLYRQHHGLRQAHNKKGHHDKGHKKGHHQGHSKGKGHKHHKKKECIRVDGRVGYHNGLENQLWYWREDLSLQQHHWWWHQSHPMNSTRHPDRRGELFMFLHRNILARYNAERFANGLPQTFEMDFQPGGIIHEEYDSHLADLASGKHWAARPGKLPLSDIIHEDDPNFSRNIIIPDVMALYMSLLKAIKSGKMITKSGKTMKISNANGFEPFVNTVEATELSVNPFYYDAFGLHNLGHLMIALVADPLYELKIPPGVLAEQATAMRDPAFYTYHTVIDNLFEKYKQNLPPYRVIGGQFPLLWRGIEVLHVEVVSKGNEVVNQLRTFWTDRKFELAPGVDGSTEVHDGEHAEVCAVHLAHEPFTFNIVIERKPCAKSKSSKGTIRIFMAPRFDDKGRRLHFKDQRRLMFQLDAFQVKLRVGKNIITRRSHDSSLTKPWSRSLHEYEDLLEHSEGTPEAADFCGCGWPQHLYIPRGHPDGMPFDLFVMATNFDEDRVMDDPKNLQFPETCNSPYLFCGLPRRRYPDARPMGYPFDRPTNRSPIPCHPGHSFASIICKNLNLVFHKPVETLEQFVRKARNMHSVVVDIKHIDQYVDNYHHE